MRSLVVCSILLCSLAVSSDSSLDLHLLPLNDAPYAELTNVGPDAKALDEMLGGATGQRLRRQAPELTVLVSVMDYEQNDGSEYRATAEQLTEEEMLQLVQHLTDGLRLLTGDTFEAFAASTARY